MPHDYNESLMTPEEQSDRKSLLGFSFLHFMNDMHSTSLPTIIPMCRLHIDIFEPGGDPECRFRADEPFRPADSRISGGQTEKALARGMGPDAEHRRGMSFAHFPNYAIAFLLVGLMSMGTASFHPQGLRTYGIVCKSKDLALFIALFAACGSFGSAVGPVYVVFLISLIGKNMFPIVLIPAFIICTSGKRSFRIRRLRTSQKKRQTFGDFSRTWGHHAEDLSHSIRSDRSKRCSASGIKLSCPCSL